MTSSPARRLIVAGLAALVLAGCDPGARDPVAAPRPSPPVLPPLVMSREVRFLTGAEEQTERGVFTTVITDRQLPPDETVMAEAQLIRVPGESAPAPADDFPATRYRRFTVAGTTVRLAESEAGPGVYRQLEWILGGTRYILVCGSYTTGDDTVYGPDEADLRWLAERFIRPG